MQATKNEIIAELTINILLITPVSDIIEKLEKNQYWDRDVEWLSKQLAKYTQIACDILGQSNLKFIIETETEYRKTYKTIDKEYYLKNFKTLLEYFKSL